MVDVETVRWAAATLHAKMTEMGGDRLFLPTGGAFLSLSPGRFEDIISESREFTNEDAFVVYAKWHEGVHMAQLVTSPFVFPIAFDLAGIAQRACRISAGLDNHTNVIIDDLAKQYRSLNGFLKDRDGVYSPMDIIETHAVTQALRWTMPHSNRESLRLFANILYEDKTPTDYVRLLNNVSESFDDDIGTILLARLCFLSLQAEKPVRQLQCLLDKLAGEPLHRDILDYTPIQLCEWAGAPVSLVSRSLRERHASFARNADGQPRRLTDHPWVGLFAQYFDEFEAIAESGERLDLLMGRRGADAYSQFSPRFTVYSGGDVRIRNTDPDDQSEIAQEARYGLVEMTLNMVSGLEFLRHHLDTHRL